MPGGDLRVGPHFVWGKHGSDSCVRAGKQRRPMFARLGGERLGEPALDARPFGPAHVVGDFTEAERAPQRLEEAALQRADGHIPAVCAGIATVEGGSTAEEPFARA